MSTIESIRKELKRIMDADDAIPVEYALLAVLDATRFDITAVECDGVMNYDEKPNPDGEYILAEELLDAIVRAWDDKK